MLISFKSELHTYIQTSNNHTFYPFNLAWYNTSSEKESIQTPIKSERYWFLFCNLFLKCCFDYVTLSYSLLQIHTQHVEMNTTGVTSYLNIMYARIAFTESNAAIPAPTGVDETGHNRLNINLSDTSRSALSSFSLWSKERWRISSGRQLWYTSYWYLVDLASPP